MYFGDLLGNYIDFEPAYNESNTPPWSIAVSITDKFGMLNDNTLESDGKRSITLDPADGDMPVRTPTADNLGEWHYRVGDGETLSCEFYIDPDKLILEEPDLASALPPRD